MDDLMSSFGVSSFDRAANDNGILPEQSHQTVDASEVESSALVVPFTEPFKARKSDPSSQQKICIGTVLQPYSRLHNLPAELREMIYEFVVVSDDPLPSRVVQRDVKPPGKANFETQVHVLPGQPALACTDQLMRKDVLRIFYSKNTFLFRVTNFTMDPLQTWLSALGPDHSDAIKLIRRVALERSLRKNCEPSAESHIYRVVVEQSPLDETLSVHCEADIAHLCTCALDAAARLKAKGMSLTGFRTRNINEPLAFAADLEAQIYTSFGTECRWSLCHEKRKATCEDCGRVFLSQKWEDGKMGSGLLEPYGWLRAREEESTAERVEANRVRAEQMRAMVEHSNELRESGRRRIRGVEQIL